MINYSFTMTFTTAVNIKIILSLSTPSQTKPIHSLISEGMSLVEAICTGSTIVVKTLLSQKNTLPANI